MLVVFRIGLLGVLAVFLGWGEVFVEGLLEGWGVLGRIVYGFVFRVKSRGGIGFGSFVFFL